MTALPRRVLFLAPALALLILAGWFAVALKPGRDPAFVPSALIDKPAPEFALPGLIDTGPGLSRADLIGQVSILNVFASWCLPCRAEHPVLMRLAREAGIPVYGLNWKDKPEAASAWLAELGNPFLRIGVDATGRAGIDWGVYGVPETYVVDATGVIRLKHVGPLSERDVEETILPLVRRLAR
jgi:cytochrome c biogenesis protein CcmG/thiol:disulfide interchange protein DsbE